MSYIKDIQPKMYKINDDRSFSILAEFNVNKESDSYLKVMNMDYDTYYKAFHEHIKYGDIRTLCVPEDGECFIVDSRIPDEYYAENMTPGDLLE